MPHTPLTLTPCSASPSHLSPKAVVFSRLRRTTAVAAGLEAMAEKALDDGEASSEQLEHLANMAAHLTQQLGELSQQFAEMSKE